MKFLLLKKDINRHSDDGEWDAVGEFETDEVANAAILANIGKYQQAGDGCGTVFSKVDEQDYTTLPDGRWAWDGSQVWHIALSRDITSKLNPY